MKIVDFEGVTCKFAEDQPEYETLPAHVSNTRELVVTSCWELTDEELKLLFTTKRIYVQLMTFGNGLPPQFLSVIKPELK